MLINVSELTGAALDWAVAKCEGWMSEEHAEGSEFWMEHEKHSPRYSGELAYSSDWSQGGPIVERECIHLCPIFYGVSPSWKAWKDSESGQEPRETGIDPLVAGMRAYVASKLGDSVDIPDELL